MRGVHRRLHDRRGRIKTAIHANGAQQSFAGVRQNDFLPAAAGPGLARRHHHVWSKLEPPGDFGARFFANERIEMPRQLDLARRREAGEQKRRDGETQDAVAQKFQPLIVPAALLDSRARMRQRFFEKALIFETIAEKSLKLFDVRLLYSHLVDHGPYARPANFHRPEPRRKPAGVLVD